MLHHRTWRHYLPTFGSVPLHHGQQLGEPPRHTSRPSPSRPEWPRTRYWHGQKSKQRTDVSTFTRTSSLSLVGERTEHGSCVMRLYDQHHHRSIAVVQPNALVGRMQGAGEASRSVTRTAQAWKNSVVNTKPITIVAGFYVV